MNSERKMLQLSTGVWCIHLFIFIKIKNAQNQYGKMNHSNNWSIAFRGFHNCHHYYHDRTQRTLGEGVQKKPTLGLFLKKENDAPF